MKEGTKYNLKYNFVLEGKGERKELLFWEGIVWGYLVYFFVF